MNVNSSQRNTIEIITSTSHYAQSNGLAERAVQICKNILKRTENEEEIIEAIMAYRTTPTKHMKYTPLA